MTNLIILLATTFTLGMTGSTMQGVDPGVYEIGPDRPLLHAGSGQAGRTSTKFEITWTGSGFLCLKPGNTCSATIGIGLNVGAKPEEFNMPIGSNVGILETVNDAPPPPDVPLSLGEHNVQEHQIRVIEGNPLPPGTTIYIPEQETIFDPARGHMFYYFGG